MLFIPSLWFHNVVSLDFSVAVNVFWRSLPKEMYDPKDTYGNKDPLPVTQLILTCTQLILTSLNSKAHLHMYLRQQGPAAC